MSYTIGCPYLLMMAIKDILVAPISVLKHRPGHRSAAAALQFDNQEQVEEEKTPYLVQRN